MGILTGNSVSTSRAKAPSAISVETGVVYLISENLSSKNFLLDRFLFV